MENKTYDFEVEVYCTINYGVEAPDFEKAKEMFKEYLNKQTILNEIYADYDVVDYDVYSRLADSSDEAFADAEFPVEINDDEMDDKIYIIG